MHFLPDGRIQVDDGDRVGVDFFFVEELGRREPYEVVNSGNVRLDVQSGLKVQGSHGLDGDGVHEVLCDGEEEDCAVVHVAR